MSQRVAGGEEAQGNVVVLGGYGAVGKAACRVLGTRLPGRVLAAGRDRGKVEAISRETGGKVLSLRLDLDDPREVGRALDGARVVVACAGQDDVGLARECLRRGVHYVNVSASYEFLAEIERLDGPARSTGATAVLSVGLAPGLTNLLAKRCVDVLGDVRSLDLYVLIGLGESHGEAAVRWTVDNLDKRFAAPGAAGPREVGSLEDPKATVFPGGYGRRTCYRFNFPDQHIVSRTLGVEEVATRLCFDPAWSTRLLALLKRVGALRMLRCRGVRDTLVALLTQVRAGSEGFAVTAEAEGADGRSFSCSASGYGEARATGVIAALVAERLHADPSTLESGGVYHAEQVFDPAEILRSLDEHGIDVDLCMVD